MDRTEVKLSINIFLDLHSVPHSNLLENGRGLVTIKMASSLNALIRI